MAIAKGFAATAVFAGVAFGAAGMAWADTPTMDGSYTETSTSPDGKTVSTSWSVNSCGDGCIYIKAGAGGHQAHLVDGQWVSDTFNDALCPDGSYVMYASKAHMTWDPNTLAGTADLTYIIPACGKPAGYTQTNKIEIKQSS
ncbi:hypothetical protein MSAS_19880 [Mycobacterium saskatchewanense]|uniref:Lipoprotein n=1 Tax=Mycobacterium saskatchewanense TaxID=220927 RepID=A0AAJ3TXC1_9MYCO|nr:hypothetical protein [Mycobacterium saskatchewanense]ORW72162.1 hypothetical protein AWC23_11610 [Mycobacterium saskatchewanense]BBX62814.1 hypothetical protein MSAS_19880 [Mycobacterium saskatchewanense]